MPGQAGPGCLPVLATGHLGDGKQGIFELDILAIEKLQPEADAERVEMGGEFSTVLLVGAPGERCRKILPEGGGLLQPGAGQLAADLAFQR